MVPMATTFFKFFTHLDPLPVSSKLSPVYRHAFVTCIVVRSMYEPAMPFIAWSSKVAGLLDTLDR